MSAERKKYSDDQLPVLAVLQSEADFPVKRLFRMGRASSTFFERERKDNDEDPAERDNATTGCTEILNAEDANRLAVGFFELYRTHTLRDGPCREKQSEERAKSTTQGMLLQDYSANSNAWDEDDGPGAKISFSDVELGFDGCLERTTKSARHNPYLMVLVDEEISDGHGDISNDKVMGFIRQLVLISNQYKKQENREDAREKVEKEVRAIMKQSQ